MLDCNKQVITVGINRIVCVDLSVAMQSMCWGSMRVIMYRTYTMSVQESEWECGVI